MIRVLFSVSNSCLIFLVVEVRIKAECLNRGPIDFHVPISHEKKRGDIERYDDAIFFFGCKRNGRGESILFFNAPYLKNPFNNSSC